MGVTVTLEKRGLDRLLTEMMPACDAVVRATALSIERDAKISAPVDTGFLRSSIAMHDAQPMDAKAEVVVGAEYGAAVERGMHHRKPRPYLEPAVNKHRPAFEAAVASLLRKLGD